MNSIRSLRRFLRLPLAAAAVLAVSGCLVAVDDSEPVGADPAAEDADGAADGFDGGGAVSPEDAGPGRYDAAWPDADYPDTGSWVTDAGHRGDAGGWPFDAGAPPDAGAFDGGMWRSDGGPHWSDAGAPFDAGTYPPDAAVFDAGPAPCPSWAPDRCGAICTNLADDENNCGACGHVCASGGVCTAGSCPQVHRVFVTPESYQGALGGLAGADAICQSAADAAGLGGTFKAWLSTAAEPAKDRFAATPGPYELIDGTAVAADFSEFLKGFLRHRIDLTSAGERVASYAMWSDTTNGGEFVGWDCNQWSSPRYEDFGSIVATRPNEMTWVANGFATCSARQQFICLEP